MNVRRISLNKREIENSAKGNLVKVLHPLPTYNSNKTKMRKCDSQTTLYQCYIHSIAVMDSIISGGPINRTRTQHWLNDRWPRNPWSISSYFYGMPEESAIIICHPSNIHSSLSEMCSRYSGVKWFTDWNHIIQSVRFWFDSGCTF